MFCPPWSSWEGLSSLNLHRSSHLCGRNLELPLSAGLSCMVMLRLCGLSLLREDDLLLELCLVYGVGGLLLFDRCPWGDLLWAQMWSGVCLHPVFLSLLVCLSVLGCFERLVLMFLWCSLTLDLLRLLLSSCQFAGFWGHDGRLPWL